MQHNKILRELASAHSLAAFLARPAFFSVGKLPENIFKQNHFLKAWGIVYGVVFFSKRDYLITGSCF